MPSSPSSAPQRILAVDIGGTNSRFAWFDVRDGRPSLVEQRWLKSHESRSFAELAGRAAAEGYDPRLADACVLGVAGAVVGGTRCDPPNTPWDIDLARDGVGLGLTHALMINDFVAQAYATATEPGLRASLLQAGEPRSGAATAVIGAGTGLGHSALIPSGHGVVPVVPLISEAGHAAFPFVGRDEAAFARFVEARVNAPYADVEDVVSGRGLSLVHEFHTGKALDTAAVAKELGTDSPTLAWFARFYGRVARNWTLSVLALGGLWISGGMAARTPALVEHPAFLAEFTLSPDYHHLLARVPVRLMTDQDAGLYGAAQCGLLALGQTG